MDLGVLVDPYQFFRGGIGFALAAVGLSFYFEPEASRVRRSYGALNLAVGALFSISFLDPVLPLPIDLGNAIVANLVLVVSQATYSMVLFVFGGQRRRGQARRVLRVGIVVTQAVWVLPLLDWVFGLPAVAVSPEDGNALGPLHLAASFLVYAWPAVVCVLAVRHGRWRLSDLGSAADTARHLLRGIQAAGAIIIFIIVAAVAGSEVLYRIGQLGLMFFLVVWYWMMTRNPWGFVRVRRAVRENHERRVMVEVSEAEIIAQRMEALVREGIFREPDLSLTALAARVRLPAYRLSHYFNTHQGMSFPVWLNTQRIAWVCDQMLKRPEASILELATEAGYGSKTAFNTQFLRIVGEAPSAWRRARGEAGMDS